MICFYDFTFEEDLVEFDYQDSLSFLLLSSLLAKFTIGFQQLLFDDGFL